jgi:DNA-binding NarL/FixJ family response regulator
MGGKHLKESPNLTPRESEVAGLICSGLKNRQIAEEMGIDVGTVKVYASRIYRRLELNGGRNARVALVNRLRPFQGGDLGFSRIPVTPFGDTLSKEVYR